MPGPHACTPALTVCGRRTPTTCPRDGKPGESECLSSDAPHKGTRCPPQGCAPTSPTARNGSSQERTRCGVGARCPYQNSGRPRHTGNRPRLPPPGDEQPGEGERLTDPRRPSRQRPRATSHQPRGRQRPAGHANQRASARSPKACTPAPTASGQRTATACLKDTQPREGERLTLDAPYKDMRCPPLGIPSCHPHSAKRQHERVYAVGLALGPQIRTPTPKRDGQQALAAYLKNGQLGEEQRLTQDALPGGTRRLSRGCPPATPTARNASSQ